MLNLTHRDRKINIYVRENKKLTDTIVAYKSEDRIRSGQGTSVEYKIPDGDRV